jgi:hypothetical protein
MHHEHKKCRAIKQMKAVMLRLVAQKMENKLTFKYRISSNSGYPK